MTEEYEKLGKWEFSCGTLYGLEEVGESSELWAVGVSDGSGREAGREGEGSPLTCVWPRLKDI